MSHRSGGRSWVKGGVSLGVVSECDPSHMTDSLLIPVHQDGIFSLPFSWMMRFKLHLSWGGSFQTVSKINNSSLTLFMTDMLVTVSRSN